MKDSILIELLRDRKQEGIEALTSKYGALMRYIITPILTDYREQEECLADVTYRIWEKIDTYDAYRGNFIAWISAIARNTAYNRARSISRQGELQEITEDMVSRERGPEEEILYREQMTVLRRVLAGLSDKDRALVYRKYFYMQSTEQIAAELGLTERAVEGRLYRIKKKLRGKCDD